MITEDDMNHVGERCMKYVRDLWPVTRSVCGPGLRSSIEYFQKLHTGIEIIEIPTGTELSGGWIVPQEWRFDFALLEHENGQRYLDTALSNLNVVNYSEGICSYVTFEELDEHLHYIEEYPAATPYITSYYRRTWGLCMSHQQYMALPREGAFRVEIKAEHYDGSMSMGHIILPGESKDEILLTSYLCHPSMANNELSGPALLFEVLRYVASLKRTRYTYRFLLGPETIGAIAYLSYYGEYLKERVVAGFGLSCVGDDMNYSYVTTPSKLTLADKAIEAALVGYSNVSEYSYADRGSEERQFASAVASLPYVAFARTRAGAYREYHTDQDNLDVISASGFEGAFSVIKSVVDAFEMGCYPQSCSFGEPFLSKYDLYSTDAHTGIWSDRLAARMNILAYSNGSRSIYDICITCSIPLKVALDECKQLAEKGLLKLHHKPNGSGIGGDQ